jgi:F-type H+-transporting ATPase subunit delta
MPLIETQPDAVARTYARSLYELADAAGGRARVEEVMGELEEILDLARGNGAFGEFLASRSVSSEARGASLDRIFRGRVTDLTLRFLLILNEKGRIGSLPAIAAAFDSLVQERFGRIEVDVVTAAPIDAAASLSLRERLARALRKEVVLHAYTEPAMIGGVKFRIGDQLIDASVATRLRRMRDKIDAAGGAALRDRIDDIIRGD